MVTAFDALSVALALPAGLAVADLVSAIAHWFGDTYFAADAPLLGPIVGPFRLHHADPDAFRRHGVFERNRNNVLAALPLLVFAAWLAPWASAAGHPFWGATLAVASIALAGATQIHAWAHDDDVPRLVGRLQRCGILLSRERHARHHRNAHDRAYAIVNGWANAALDCTAFFRRAETVAARLGLRPVNLEPAQRARGER